MSVFDRAWFERHQRVLIALLNAPLIGRWFKWVLCIRRCDLGYRRRIDVIYPHAYEVENADGTRTIEIRAHAKFAKRLYHAFYWLWVACHLWDAMVTPMGGALNLGFDTLTAFPDASPESTSVDGDAARAFASESFSTIRAGAGNSVSDASATFNVRLDGDSLTDKFSTLGRGVTLFDVSSIPSTHLIGPVSVSLYLTDKVNNLGSTDLHACTVSPASNTAIANADYATFGSTSYGSVAYASATLNAYNVVGIGANGYASVLAGGIAKIGWRLAWDLTGSFTGTWGNQTTWFVASAADQAGTSQDPKLVVVHTVPSITAAFLNRKRRAGHSVSSPGGYF